jgi:hypothetical protein
MEKKCLCVKFLARFEKSTFEEAEFVSRLTSP